MSVEKGDVIEVGTGEQMSSLKSRIQTENGAK